MLRSLVGSLLAVAAVLALLGVVQGWRGQPPAAGPGFAVAPGAAPTPPASPVPTGGPHKATAPGPPTLLLLNNSRVPGLAASAAADFRAAGWPVADTGNLRGRIRTTTVYYSAGYAEPARRLAARFPGIRRVLPRLAGLPGRAPLTVVVTGEFPAG